MRRLSRLLVILFLVCVVSPFLRAESTLSSSSDADFSTTTPSPDSAPPSAAASLASTTTESSETTLSTSSEATLASTPVETSSTPSPSTSNSPDFPTDVPTSSLSDLTPSPTVTPTIETISSASGTLVTIVATETIVPDPTPELPTEFLSFQEWRAKQALLTELAPPPSSKKRRAKTSKQIREATFDGDGADLGSLFSNSAEDDGVGFDGDGTDPLLLRIENREKLSQGFGQVGGAEEPHHDDSTPQTQNEVGGTRPTPLSTRIPYPPPNAKLDRPSSPGSLSSPIQPVAHAGTGDPLLDPLLSLKDRSNFANLDCNAMIHRSSKQSKHSSSILVEKKDRYMLSPCSVEKKFVELELCDEIQIDSLVLANFEFFSSMFKNFQVKVSKKYPGKKEDWIQLGVFRARNMRGLQVFRAPPLPSFYRYVRIEFLTHYGAEYYCPVSLLRVYGITAEEAFRTWEEETNKVEARVRAQEEGRIDEDDEDGDEEEEEVALKEETKVEVQPVEVEAKSMEEFISEQVISSAGSVEREDDQFAEGAPVTKGSAAIVGNATAINTSASIPTEADSPDPVVVITTSQDAFASSPVVETIPPSSAASTPSGAITTAWTSESATPTHTSSLSPTISVNSQIDSTTLPASSVELTSVPTSTEVPVTTEGVTSSERPANPKHSSSPDASKAHSETTMNGVEDDTLPAETPSRSKSQMDSSAEAISASPSLTEASPTSQSPETSSTLSPSSTSTVTTATSESESSAVLSSSSAVQTSISSPPPSSTAPASTPSSSTTYASTATRRTNETYTPSATPTRIILPPAQLPQPGDSIYGTIVKRIISLEMDLGLSLKYVEEVGKGVREGVARIEKRMHEVESLKHTHDQLIREALAQLEKHSRAVDQDRIALSSQVELLSEELLFEKRLGVAQLVGLLALFLFVGVTRGSPTTPFLHIAQSQAFKRRRKLSQEEEELQKEEAKRREEVPRRGFSESASEGVKKSSLEARRSSVKRSAPRRHYAKSTAPPRSWTPPPARSVGFAPFDDTFTTSVSGALGGRSVDFSAAKRSRKTSRSGPSPTSKSPLVGTNLNGLFINNLGEPSGGRNGFRSERPHFDTRPSAAEDADGEGAADEPSDEAMSTTTAPGEEDLDDRGYRTLSASESEEERPLPPAFGAAIDATRKPPKAHVARRPSTSPMVGSSLAPAFEPSSRLPSPPPEPELAATAQIKVEREFVVTEQVDANGVVFPTSEK